MKKVYENGTIYVLSKSYNRDIVRKATEEFLKKVISEGIPNGNINTTKNIREK